MKKEIYLDNAAATAMDPGARRAHAIAQREQGNPSALHEAGRRSAEFLARARVGVARFLNARPDEVVFCSSGSEANTLAILGVAAAVPSGMRHIVTTAIEHPSVLEPVRRLHRQGWESAVLKVGSDGALSEEAVRKALKKGTAVVSVAYANNEIGTVQPIRKIAKIIRDWRRAHRTPYPYLHTDACQATAWLPMDVQVLGADLLTLNGAKSYGPRGTAVLFVRRGISIVPQTLGGDQERGVRAGTEDVPGIAGLAAALAGIRSSDAVRTARLRDRLIEGIFEAIPKARLNGPEPAQRLSNNANFAFTGVDSEALVLELDRRGIRVSSGSACTARDTGPSHVLVAIGTSRAYRNGAVRFSLSRRTTKAEIDAVLRALPGAVRRIRARRS